MNKSSNSYVRKKGMVENKAFKEKEKDFHLAFQTQEQTRQR